MDWQTTYYAAVVETDSQKIFGRIAAAREDINAALIAANDPEIEDMQKALKALAILEIDARSWPKNGRRAQP
jgi:hypothetical protein